MVDAINICCLFQLNENGHLFYNHFKGFNKPNRHFTKLQLLSARFSILKSGLCSQWRKKEWNVVDLNDYVLKIVFLSLSCRFQGENVIKTKKYNISNLANEDALKINTWEANKNILNGSSSSYWFKYCPVLDYWILPSVVRFTVCGKGSIDSSISWANIWKPL